MYKVLKTKAWHYGQIIWSDPFIEQIPYSSHKENVN